MTIADVLEWKPTIDSIDTIEPVWPSYDDKGRVLFYFAPIANEKPHIEVIDFDGNSSLHWMNEGIGVDYWLKELDLEFELDGFYVIEDIHGQYFRGNWSWGEDDDEEWYHGNMRRASEEEIKTQALEGNIHEPLTCDIWLGRDVKGKALYVIYEPYDEAMNYPKIIPSAYCWMVPGTWTGE